VGSTMNWPCEGKMAVAGVGTTGCPGKRLVLDAPTWLQPYPVPPASHGLG
jgi:hypothetical protein